MDKIADFVDCIRPTYDDDSIDRLHYFWTCLLTVIFSTTVAACQFGGSSIQCWTPAEFTSSWERYAERNCFMENVYVLQDGSLKREVLYYPWIPFLLAVQGALFYLPHVIWSQLNVMTGLNLRAIIRKVKTTDNHKYVARKIAIMLVKSMQIQEDLNENRGGISVVIQCGRAQGVYMTVVYLSVKMMYLINVTGQFFFLNRFFGMGWTHIWGWELMLKSLKDPFWPRPAKEDYDAVIAQREQLLWDGLFPRLMYCSLELKALGNVHHVQLQCILWINMLNEKVFLILWWWFLSVGILTACNLVSWLFAMAVPSAQDAFVARYLRIRRLIQHGNAHMVQRFIMTTLKTDGILMMRILSDNIGDLYITDVFEVLWWRFHEENYGGGVGIVPSETLESEF